MSSSPSWRGSLLGIGEKSLFHVTQLHLFIQRSSMMNVPSDIGCNEPSLTCGSNPWLNAMWTWTTSLEIARVLCLLVLMVDCNSNWNFLLTWFVTTVGPPSYHILWYTRKFSNLGRNITFSTPKWDHIFMPFMRFFFACHFCTRQEHHSIHCITSI